jgi:hypothetical protein
MKPHTQEQIMRFFAAAFAVLSFPVICLAEEAAKVAEKAAEAAAPAAPVVAEASWLSGNMELIVGAVVAILTAFGLWDKLSAKAKDLVGEKNMKIWEIVKGAVTETYTDYVREIKKGKADGKLTADEAKEARKRATEKAIAAAKENGITIASHLLPTLIEKAVNYMKKDAPAKPVEVPVTAPAEEAKQ